MTTQIRRVLFMRSNQPGGRPIHKSFCIRSGHSLPLFFQNSILQGVFIFRGAIGIFHKRNKFFKEAFLPHTELFTQMLRRKVVVFRVSVDSASAFLLKKILEECFRRLKGVAFSLVGFVQHPAGAERILVVSFRMRFYLAYDLTGFF